MSDVTNNTASSDIVTGRVALGLSYKGTLYCGWQSQPDGVPSVQAELEKALSVVANESVKVTCAGRTDKAVHASYQVVHFDTQALRTERSWVFGCNANLPPGIAVSWVRNVSEDFSARFSATSRRYNYFIYNHPIRPAHYYEEMTWCHYPLDEVAMHEAAQALVGEHDFTSFRAVGCQSKTAIRTLEWVRVRRFSDVVMLDVKGNAFLHHMVRNIAGVLIAIGNQKESVSWCQEVLDAKDRTKAGVTAPPYGLFLTDVAYPEEFGLPRSPGAPGMVQALLRAADGDLQEKDEIWDISRPPAQ